MHVHGTDGLHIKYDNEAEKLALYWGESKLYQNFSEAIDACLESLGPFLSDDSKAANRRDLQLFRDNLDLLDESLEDELLNFLNPEHPHFNKVQFRGVCLIGFDEEMYPNEPNQKNSSKLKAEMEEALDQWVEKVKEKIKKRASLDSFYIEIFLIPLPSAQGFRDAFREEVGNG